MSEQEMLEQFGPEQGARLVFDHGSATKSCAAEIRATDSDAAVKGLAMLVIRLAEELGVPTEHVLAKIAVTVMEIAGTDK